MGVGCCTNVSRCFQAPINARLHFSARMQMIHAAYYIWFAMAKLILHGSTVMKGRRTLDVLLLPRDLPFSSRLFSTTSCCHSWMRICSLVRSLDGRIQLHHSDEQQNRATKQLIGLFLASHARRRPGCCSSWQRTVLDIASISFIITCALAGFTKGPPPLTLTTAQPFLVMVTASNSRPTKNDRLHSLSVRLSGPDVSPWTPPPPRTLTIGYHYSSGLTKKND